MCVALWSNFKKKKKEQEVEQPAAAAAATGDTDTGTGGGVNAFSLMDMSVNGSTPEGGDRGEKEVSAWPLLP